MRRRALLVDATLLIALVASVVALFRSPDLHGLVSFGLVGAVGAHVAIHLRWWRRAVARVRARSGVSRRTVRDLTVASALAALAAPTLLTGVSLLTRLDRGDDLHTVGGWLFVAVVAVHVALHARWIRASLVPARGG